MEISQEDLRYLKDQIENTMESLEILQRKHRSLTGRNHIMSLYLTDPCNRATMKPNANRRPRQDDYPRGK